MKNQNTKKSFTCHMPDLDYQTLIKINDIYHDCLIGEPFTDEKEVVKTWHDTIIFSKEKLKEHKEDITNLLKSLPERFHTPNGVCTFLKTESKLLELGTAIGQVKCEKNTDFASILPIGMPIYTIIKEKE